MAPKLGRHSTNLVAGCASFHAASSRLPSILKLAVVLLAGRVLGGVDWPNNMVEHSNAMHTKMAGFLFMCVGLATVIQQSFTKIYVSGSDCVTVCHKIF